MINHIMNYLLKYNSLMNDKGYLNQILKDGCINAKHRARKTLQKVYRKIGFVQ